MVEVQFNSRARSKYSAEVKTIAGAHGARDAGETSVVTFTSFKDPDLERLLTYVGRFKGTRVFMGGRELYARNALSIIACRRELEPAQLPRHRMRSQL